MKYLVSETTKEERQKLVYKALGISLSGADYPDDYVLKLVNEYIEGTMELEEVQKKVLVYYKGDKNE